MKMRNLIMILASLLILTACNDDKIGPSKIEIPGMDEIMNDPTDSYIYKNFTKPFNVTVQYKWNYAMTEMSKQLVPPSEELVIPFLDVILRAWVDPYEQMDKKSEGIFSFPKLVPKSILLLGSSGWNNDGTVTQGTAEGGRKIVLYEVNQYKKTDIDKLQRYFHVMHHEFAHILHQNNEFGPEYQKLSIGLYTSTWYLYTSEYANEKGFITNYAMSEYHEDFVEMVAMMLTMSRNEWDNFVNKQIPESGRSIIIKKGDFVIGYFRDKWNIDIFELQSIIQQKIQEIITENGGTAVSLKDASRKDSRHAYDAEHFCTYCRQNGVSQTK